MNRWFRFYNDALRNPKVAALSDRDFRTWVSLLAIANENGGTIPSLDPLKHLLMMRLDHLSCALDRLARAGLIDPLGTGYEPHNWDKFQYKSDTSGERVTLHRRRKSVTPVTAPDSDTDTDADIPLSNDNGQNGFLPFLQPIGPAPTTVDPAKAFWDNAVKYVGTGKRALIGRWIKAHGMDAVTAALSAAQAQGVFDPIPWVEARFATNGGKGRAPDHPNWGPGDPEHSGIPI